MAASGGVSGGRRSLSKDRTAPSDPPSYWNGVDTSANDRAHVFHSWSAQALINPLAIAGGEGSWVWDFDDNRYLDFSSQLMNVNLGHRHPKLVAAIQEAAGRLATISPVHANADRSEAARLIAEVAPEQLNKVFFTNGGADANENAIRMARLHTGRHKVLAAHRSYHGATAGAITMTGDPRRWASEPSIPGVVRFFGPYPYRSSFHADSPAQECDRALAHLDELLMFEGPHNVAAIILEPVVGTNGILVPPDGYLAGVRELCDRHGIMMISDEVMAGFGRCGEWFASEKMFGVVPDIITFAKGVTSGYVPLGGLAISEKLLARVSGDNAKGGYFTNGYTYTGHPVSCAAALANIAIIEDSNLLDHVREMSEHFAAGLNSLADLPLVADVRSSGLVGCVECLADKSHVVADDFDRKIGARIDAICFDLGLIVRPIGHMCVLSPPLIITREEIDRIIAILRQGILQAADELARGEIR